MGDTLNLGRRVELVPMDSHFHDISIALYMDAGGYRVHSYSRKSGVEDRLASVRKTMVTVGGIVEGDDGLLRFPCGDPHERACKRLFLESVKQTPTEEAAPRPLEIVDKKSGLTMRVTSEGEGSFRVSAEGEADKKERRIATIAGGLAKLGDLDWSEDTQPDRVRFQCGHGHVELTGLLLVRAPNVRAVLREEQSAASRGVLAAPSQQKS